MVYKREFFKCIAGEFVMSCNLGLKKIGNIQTARSTSTSKGYGYTSSGSRKTSTNNVRNTTVSAAGSARR